MGYDASGHALSRAKTIFLTCAIDIERTYGGGKQPIAGKRSSGAWGQLKDNASSTTSKLSSTAKDSLRVFVPHVDDATPGATEGETDSDWDDHHEATTPQSPMVNLPDAFAIDQRDPATVTKATFGSTGGALDTTAPASLEPSSTTGSDGNKLSMKALTIKYLQKPIVIFSNIDMFRCVVSCTFVNHCSCLSQNLDPMTSCLSC